MNIAQVKFLISLAIILALWRVFEIPGVSTAFWAFITVGAIPGSTRVLGSDTMLRILCVLFAICFFLIFRKEFMASLPRRRPAFHETTSKNPKEEKAGAAAQAVQPDRPNPLERSVIILNRQKDRPVLQPVRPLLLALCFMAAGIVTVVTKAEHGAEQCIRLAGKHIKRAAVAGYPLLRFAGSKAYRYLYMGGRALIRAVVWGWQAAEPHIRTFDRWLEAHLRANHSTAQVVRTMDLFGKTAVDGYRKAQNAKRKLLEDK